MSFRGEISLKTFSEHSKSTHALGRAGEAEEVAKAIVFLASNKLSGFMTGVTLPVDGGSGVCAHAECMYRLFTI